MSIMTTGEGSMITMCLSTSINPIKAAGATIVIILSVFVFILLCTYADSLAFDVP